MKSALIIRGGAIGDFILTLPALRVFRDRFPEVRVEMMGYPHITELALQRFYAEGVRSLDHRHAAAFFAHRGPLGEDLSRYFASFDLIVSYLYDPDEIFQTNLRRAGARRVIVADGKPSGTDHASAYLAAWLSEMGVPPGVGSPSLYPREEDRAEARRLFPILEQGLVTALHPGSGSPSKNWPVVRFCELAAELRKAGMRLIVLTGPADSEADAGFWKDVRSAGCDRCHWVALPIVAAVLQQCAAFIGHDSGISHMAAAVGVPTVAIFGPTNPAVWEPRGKSVTILRKGASPAAVSVGDVKEVLNGILKERAEGSGRKTED